MPKTVLPEKYSKVEFPLWLHAIPIAAWRVEVWEDGFGLWGAEGATHTRGAPAAPSSVGNWPLSPGSAENGPSNIPGWWEGDFPGLGVAPHGAKAFTAL